MNISDEMFDAGQKTVEENVMRFWTSSRDDNAWRWFLSIVYTSMRELEPDESPKPKK